MKERSASRAEIDALIRLLDDPDEGVQRAVYNRLRDLGARVLPHLRERHAVADEPLRGTLGRAIHDLHFHDVETAWRAVMEMPEADLERGAFLLALYRFPDLDLQRYREELDRMAEQAAGQMGGRQGVARAFELSRFFCEDLGFTGNTRHYYDPNNSYLNWVMDHRQGIPVSLSVIFLLLARRLGLPIYGVNMPAHFLVKYEDDKNEVFMDLYNGGVPFLKEDGIRFLLQAGIKPQPEYFTAAEARTILLRMLRNLLAIAHETQQAEVRKDLERLLLPWDQSVA